MDGAETLMRTLAGAGIDVCFANPGTTELDLVRALDTVGGVRPVLGLFEGVCSGAADGFARMAGRPALTLLHLGPGFANAGANLHNARRAGTPMVVVVGDHPTTHRGYGAPLESDIESFARPVSKWVRTSASAAGVAADAHEAVVAATAPPAGVATLIVPADCAWMEAPEPHPAHLARPDARRAPAEDAEVDAAARALAESGQGALLLGGTALTERGLQAAGRVREATGCLLLCETFPARMERGGRLPSAQRLPYFPEDATAALGRAERLVLAGSPAPVAFFQYPGTPNELTPPDVPVLALATPDQDAADALERLAERVAAEASSQGGRSATRVAGAPSAPPPGPLTPDALVGTLAAAQPAGAVVVDEGLTLSEPYFGASAGAAPHTYLALTGGAIGIGLPLATGAAIACPDRPVLLLQADGSALYTLQALWTQAREGLDVTTVICANRSYRILQVELGRAGVTEPPPSAAAFTELTDPAPDWVALAAGMGVPGVQVGTVEELSRELTRALAEPGPHLIEALVA